MNDKAKYWKEVDAEKKTVYYSKEILDHFQIAYNMSDLEYKEPLGLCMKIGEIPHESDENRCPRPTTGVQETS